MFPTPLIHARQYISLKTVYRSKFLRGKSWKELRVWNLHQI